MNPYITYPLIILIIVGGFSQLYYFSSVNFDGSGSQSQTLIGNQTLTGSEDELEIEGGSLALDFSMTTGIIVIILGAIALGLIGLNVVGSGLSDFSVKIIWNGIVYYGMWAVFSVFGYNALISFPLFGIFVWFFLTFIYSLGVFSRMGI